MTIEIGPSRQTTHGFFSRELEPVVAIDSGESVAFKTLNAGWHRDPDPVTGHWHHEERLTWHEPETDTGHALCGPIAIRGAEPGMTLEVAIDSVEPGTWGFSLGGGGHTDLNRALDIADGEPSTDFWTLDAESGWATSHDGVRIRMRPFLGVMGMPPDEPGRHETGPPRTCGGNIDCKELIAGTKLYLPISVQHALFSAGDGHAVQGDGEISGVAIECPMERVVVTLSIREDMPLKAPRAWTPEGWISFGFDRDLDQAVVMAVDNLLDLMGERFGIDRKRAINLASLVADIRITQVVNGVQGAHAVLPHSFEMGSRPT